MTATISPLVVQNVRALEDYSGGPLGHWQVVAGLLLHDGGFGPRLTRTDGTPETYAVIGPVWNSSGDPDFHDDDRLQELVVHEFAHSLVNPLAEANPAIVQRYASRFELMRAAMNKVGEYDTWEIVVNEHIVRALTTRIAALRWGRAAGDAAVAREIARGFRYVPAIVGRLQTYEANRSQWPTLASYYAQLMEAFR